MSDQLRVETERVDDIPVLVMQQQRMGIPELLDRHFRVHRNWQGASPGRLTSLWLTHILSEADHRISHVRPWASQRLETLSHCSGLTLSELDFTDDRLADLLQLFSDDDQWQAFERELNQNLLRVYDLSVKRVRLDATAASSYWSVSEDGLFQFGHSKDHRPDLPQVKVMLSTLDPLGMPLATQILSGERADDRLYLPAITEVRQGLGRRGLLYIGDSKMGTQETRAFVHAGGDFYLCPLAQVQLPPEGVAGYLAALKTEEQVLTDITREQADGTLEIMAQGFEQSQELTLQWAGQTLHWRERRLIIRSQALAERALHSLQDRLALAQTALAALMERKRGKKIFHELSELRQAAEAIVKRYDVAALLQLSYEQITTERTRRHYRQRPPTTVVETTCQLQVSVDEAAVTAATTLLGWRVYATNQPAERLSLQQAVLSYRDEYLIEHNFSRLKNKPLSLKPMYLRSEARIVGLIRLLTLGLRILTSLEFVVRRRLAHKHDQLAGLYYDSPKHATARPTAERLLKAFKDLNLSTIHLGDQTLRHMTPLSALQQRILALLDFAPDIYGCLAAQSQNSA